MGSESTFNQKYAANVQLDGAAYKQVTLEMVVDTPKLNLFVTIKPENTEDYGKVIAEVLDPDVYEAIQKDDTGVRVAYDEGTQTSTYAKMSDFALISANYGGSQLSDNVYYDLHANDGNRDNGSRLASDTNPITGGHSFIEVPAAYEGVEYLAPRAYSGTVTGEGIVLTYTFNISKDAEIAVWTRGNGTNYLNLTSAKVNGEDMVNTTETDVFKTRYLNGLDIAQGDGNGYQIEYDKYGDVLLAYLKYLGYVEGVDYYISDKNQLTIVNYSAPEGWGYGSPDNRFSHIYHFCIKEDGVLMNPNEDPRTAGKSIDEIAELFDTMEGAGEDGTVAATPLVTELKWAEGRNYAVGGNDQHVEVMPKLRKFDVTASNGAFLEKGRYFGFFPDRGRDEGWGDNVGVLNTYPGVFELYNADAICFPLNCVNGNVQMTVDWTGTAQGDLTPADENLPWITFKVNQDARVMVFSTSVDYKTAVGEALAGEYTTITLEEGDYLTQSTASYDFTKLSVAEYEAGETVTIYSPNIRTCYFVAVVPAE